MTIRKIKEELESSANPIIKPIHHNKGFKVLALGFNKGMEMKAHTAKWPSRLTVLEGSVTYVEGDARTTLLQYEEHDIPVGIVHSVEAEQNSLCLLTQSDDL